MSVDLKKPSLLTCCFFAVLTLTVVLRHTPVAAW